MTDPFAITPRPTRPSRAVITPDGFTLSRLDPLFHSPLAVFRLADAARLNALLLDEIAALRAVDAGLARSNRGGWHSQDDLFERREPGLAELAGRLREAANEATRRIAPDSKPELLRLQCQGWINVNPPGAFNAPHDHPGWYWSGAYYVAAPLPAADVLTRDPTAGCIELMDSRTNLRVLSLIDAPCMAGKAVIRPEAGMLVMFPSHLRHWVYPNTAASDRISIAFNARHAQQ